MTDPRPACPECGRDMVTIHSLTGTITGFGCVDCPARTGQRNARPACPACGAELVLGFYDRPGGPPGNGWRCPNWPHEGTGKAPEPAPCPECGDPRGWDACQAEAYAEQAQRPFMGLGNLHGAAPEAKRRRVEACATCRPCVDPSCDCGGCPHSDPACPAERRGRPRSMPGYHAEPCAKCGQHTVILRCLSCSPGRGHCDCLKMYLADAGEVCPGLPDGSGDAVDPSLLEEAADFMQGIHNTRSAYRGAWLRSKIANLRAAAARLRARGTR